MRLPWQQGTKILWYIAFDDIMSAKGSATVWTSAELTQADAYTAVWQAKRTRKTNSKNGYIKPSSGKTEHESIAY